MRDFLKLEVGDLAGSGEAIICALDRGKCEV